jgi:glycosyltransferase involved in cell wall biosynthesis
MYFEEISLLITHYNRSRSLERLLSALDRANCSFNRIVVSDDSSSVEHMEFISELRDRFDFNLISSVKNKGLGHNLNKGHASIQTPYTLYIQEDFIPADDFMLHLKNGQSLLDERKDFDMVRFYAYKLFPYLKAYKYGFSEMKFKWWYPGLDKFTMYSDHPHLKRNTFSMKFGKYKEGTSGDKTEFAMMMSFLKKGGKSFFYNQYQSLLKQENSDAEPSTMKRNFWRENDSALIGVLRTMYRYVYYNGSLYLPTPTLKK